MKPSDCGAIYSDGRYFDLESGHITADIPFYLKQAQLSGGPVLELGCGTGRLTIPMAEAGFAMTGLDISAAMLEQARLKASKPGLDITWVEADCRNFSLETKFGTVIFPFNGMAHIHDRESHEALLARVREHLKPGGHFIVDWFNPALEILSRDPGKRYPCFEYDDPDGRGKVVITENNIYDRATQINHVKWYYQIGDEPEEVRELNMRILYPQEFDYLLHYNGFEILAKYGDHKESPFESKSRHQLIVCRSRSGR
jgi:SAM-dependent methyltransferase